MTTRAKIYAKKLEERKNEKNKEKEENVEKQVTVNNKQEVAKNIKKTYWDAEIAEDKGQMD